MPDTPADRLFEFAKNRLPKPTRLPQSLNPLPKNNLQQKNFQNHHGMTIAPVVANVL
ncbi:MAG: hypothetical protein U0872_01750 [Planctomycetaceae bacterium]